MTDTDGDGGRSPGPTPGERLNARLANGEPFDIEWVAQPDEVVAFI